jgi:DNA-directed RNA polymerase subunit RPC12/RpoP
MALSDVDKELGLAEEAITRADTSMLRQKNEESFACNKCPFKSIYKNNYKRHMKTHENAEESEESDEEVAEETIKTEPGTPQQYACKHCSFVSIYKNNFKRHLKTHDIEPEPEPLPEKEQVKLRPRKSYAEDSDEDLYDQFNDNSSSLQEKIAARKVDNVYKCEHCSFETVHENSFAKHCDRHKGGRVACPGCRKFFDADKFDEHYQEVHVKIANMLEKYVVDGDPKSYYCNECNYLTTFKKTMLDHLKSVNHQKVVGGLQGRQNKSSEHFLTLFQPD